jgi:hypothetical protein
MESGGAATNGHRIGRSAESGHFILEFFDLGPGSEPIRAQHFRYGGDIPY